MSFSSEVKEELAEHISSSRHCQIAEIAALFCYIGTIARDDTGSVALSIQTENEQVIRKSFTLLKKSFNISTNVLGWGSYCIRIQDETAVRMLLQALKLSYGQGHINRSIDTVHPLLIKNACCRRAFLRGA